MTIIRIILKSIITYLKLKLKIKVNSREIWRLDFFIFSIKNNIKIINETANSFIVEFKLTNKIKFEIRHYPSSDFNVFKEVIIKKQYNININNPSFIIDAGANVGYSSLYFADKYKDVTIISIEPFNENVKILMNQIKLNNFKNIHIENKALWHKKDLLELDFTYRDKRDHAIRTVSKTDISKHNQIETITLDEIFFNYNINNLDLLKIDIEGSEKQIFEDYELIDEIIHKTKNIAIEIHDEIVSRDNIENKLKKHFKQFYRLGELTIASNNE